jgi:hypothetical protein
MSMESLYIRQPNEEQGRGPYTSEQLESLASTGHIQPDTHFSTDGSEWFTIQARPELYLKLFPPQQTIRLKKKASPSVGAAATAVSAIDTAGEADDLTRILKRDATIARKQAATGLTARLLNPIPWHTQITGVIMLLTSWTLLTHYSNKITSVFGEPSLLWQHPLLTVGLIDLLVAILLFMGSRTLYSYVRARLLVMAGIALLYCWADIPFTYSIETILAAAGIIMLTGFRQGVVQAIGALICIVSLIPIALSGYTI